MSENSYCPKRKPIARIFNLSLSDVILVTLHKFCNNYNTFFEWIKYELETDF